MVERLPSLPKMQAKIDELVEAYADRDPVVTYSTDGATCIIMSTDAKGITYFTVVELDTKTLGATVREAHVHPISESDLVR